MRLKTQMRQERNRQKSDREIGDSAREGNWPQEAQKAFVPFVAIPSSS
jgi:hypothetical protein